MKAGETPGYPRFQGRDRYNSFTYPKSGNGSARWITAFWSCPRSAVWPCVGAPARGHAQDGHHSREADGWYVCISCADVPMQPFRPPGKRQALTWGWNRLPPWPMAR